MSTTNRLITRSGLIAILVAAHVGAQTPRIAPPPPCRPDALGTTFNEILNRPATRQGPIVAVLQPEARIADDAQAHLAWAVANGVTDRLRELPGVHVESRGTTERAWAEAGGRPDRLASAMGASVVMTGLVQSVRDGARVLIRLSSATDSTLWQGDFVYPGLGLVAIENEIVAAVARQVRVESPRPRSGVNEPASDALARGDYFLASHDPVGPDSARIAYQRALRAEPKSALLMTRLARAYLAGMSRTGRTASPRTPPATIQAASLIERALAADSSLADAWTAKALLSRVRDPEQYSGAVAAHERAVRLAPRNADAHHEYAVTLMQLGRDDAARSHVRSALLAEQDHASSLRLLAELEYLARRYGPSCALVNASIGADSYDPLAYSLRARVRARLGEFRDAFSDAETATRLGASRWGEALEFYVTAVGQDPDAVKTEGRRIALDRLRKGTTLGVREAAFLGMAYATAGDSNRAFDALSRSGSKTAEMRTALRDPGFDRVRSDPRFQRVGTASQPQTVRGQ